ncbi:MAG: hypothetical protein A3B44_00020 [Candidatus Levybacteria bacterium RIFCSPLOWO2_01_FULL_38_21]|nr:MAG: hypothetical protein A3B44_00020 [Candidatus Levybacteria bacterium RIFCSPLOWO2_01_FULL_38_21]
MSIFNSLGSNYDLSFALKALLPNLSQVARLFHLEGELASRRVSFNKKNGLKKFLQDKYDGETVLLFKGREAITLALKILNLPKNSKVAINGLTCYVVYHGIEEAGLRPVLLDIPKDDINFSPETLAHSLKANPDIKVVIVQNTLGYPCEIEKISEICRDNNIILIEDLAHSAGGKYENGEEMGTVGDFAVLSFSQDKIVDAVSGGALIIRNKKYEKNKIAHFENPPLQKELTDRLYPLFTYKIRKAYTVGLGKIIHFFLKITQLLSTPMDDNLYKNFLLPNWYCGLIIFAFKNLNKDLEHRKKIAKIYKNNLDKKIIPDLIDKIDLSTNLRFPIFVENRNNLIDYLEKYNIFISDIWYDAPITPKKYLSKTDYEGECPNAEKISSLTLNLPTHKNISEKNAIFITERVNKWLKSS